MASTFKFHSSINETVPWQAQYAFPSQASKVNKQIVKLPPKNGGTFAAGNNIRIELPADNYLNTLNSVLQFDLTWTDSDSKLPRFQRGGAQNLIKRLRIMYGSLVIEDIQEYKTLVRLFTEAGINNDYSSSTGTILDGMYDTSELAPEASTTRTAYGQFGVGPADGSATTRRLVDVYSTGTTDISVNKTTYDSVNSQVIRAAGDVGRDLSSSNSGTRTYCLNLLSGLLTCKKLIPLKWMAAQLSIEITLATVADCALYAASGTAPTFSLTNVNFIGEMLEFDSTYDTAFFAGLSQGGVPLSFTSWHFHTFTASSGTTVCQIHERSRSVKAAYAVVRSSATEDGLIDSDHFFHALGASYSGGLITNPTDSAIDEFQWRVGGRYYPSQPVRATYGGAEALVELLKALNALGDYTRPSNINYSNWVSTSTGAGSKFIMASEFENVDAMPNMISGINAEEQSDIALTIKTSGSGTVATKKIDVFMHFDALLIVKAGNVVELVM